jgi:hypothetical protein
VLKLAGSLDPRVHRYCEADFDKVVERKYEFYVNEVLGERIFCVKVFVACTLLVYMLYLYSLGIASCSRLDSNTCNAMNCSKDNLGRQLRLMVRLFVFYSLGYLFLSFSSLPCTINLTLQVLRRLSFTLPTTLSSRPISATCPHCTPS